MGAYAWHDLVGNIGVLMILGTYFALQAGEAAWVAVSLFGLWRAMRRRVDA